MFLNRIKRTYSFIRRFNLDVAFLGLATVTPLVILSLFIHPALDDFSFTQNAREMGIGKAIRYSYEFWNGRYSTAVLLSVNPLVWNWQLGYRLLPIVLLVLLFAALYDFVNQVSFRLLSLRTKLTATLCILIVYVSQMPSLSQGFYWMPASASYQLAIISMLFLFSVMIRAHRAEVRLLKMALSASALLLTVFIIGLNETFLPILFCVFVIVSIAGYRRRAANGFLIPLLFIGAGCAAYLVFASPGNAVRTSFFPKANGFWYAFRFSFWKAGSHALNWTGSSPLLPLTVLFVPVCLEMAFKNKNLFARSPLSMNPALSICGYCTLLGATLFPAYWSMGLPPEGRVENVTCFVFTIGWFLNVLIVCNYCVQKGVRSAGRLPAYAAVIVFVFIFCSMKIHPRQVNNIGLAWFDLLKGTAASFDKEMNDRYAVIRACRFDTCEVNPLKHVPGSIFYADIESDEKDWKNQIYASYFSKKAIRLRK